MFVYRYTYLGGARLSLWEGFMRWMAIDGCDWHDDAERVVTCCPAGVTAHDTH